MKAYSSYIQYVANQVKTVQFMCLDEIYTYIGDKNNKYYVWTGIAWTNEGQKLGFFYLSKTKTYADLVAFDKTLPQADKVYTDNNPTYQMLYGSRNIAQKGVKTNLIESLNSQLRQFTSYLRRKFKGYAKNSQMFEQTLAKIFITKIIN